MNLDNLNIEQRKAVEEMGNPVLVFAGAGSGKTRVLTYKIAYLIEEIGIVPENILAVTFTNKAADEMKSRINSLVDMDLSSLNIGTFHSVCAKILRYHANLIGFNSDFTIYDQSDSRQLFKEVINELALDVKKFIPKTCQSIISSSKNMMKGPEDVHMLTEGYLTEKIGDIFKLYQEKLLKNNAFDFDDLILKTIELFDKHLNILDVYQKKFSYVLVDEYQDTNQPQFKLINLISKSHNEICVVGDDDQSIYGWRGADIRNILDFNEQYENATIVKLEQNYRSTQNILDAAWSVVSKNFNRAEKKLWTDNKDGELIRHFECYDEVQESYKIFDIINNEINTSKYTFNDIAILYRTNAQSRVIEDQLRKNAIPYQIIGGTKFYDRKEIKDLIAYLRIIVNPHDSVSFNRVINFPIRGIGKVTVNKINDLSNLKKIDCVSTLNYIAEINIGKKQHIEIEKFHKLIDRYTSKLDKIKPSDLLFSLVDELALKAFYQNQQTAEASDRWHNIEELIASVNEFEREHPNSSIRDFLEEVSLLSDIDNMNNSRENIRLMTIHSAKGLEFKVVILPGLEENLFPLNSQMNDDLEQIEEERRLFYVALTRAEQKVFLLNSKVRRRFGTEVLLQTISRFIKEIPKHLVLNNQFSGLNSKINDSKLFTNSTREESSLRLQSGSKVRHKLFGVGVIVSVSGRGDNAKLIVSFSGNVKKKLIAKYANLECL